MKKILKEKIIKVENMDGKYLIRNQGVESEGVYINKLDVLSILKSGKGRFTKHL